MKCLIKADNKDNQDGQVLSAVDDPDGQGPL